MYRIEETNQKSTGKMKLDSCIEKSPALGNHHRDTKNFDDFEELKDFAISLMECRIIKIRLYYGSLMPTGVVNGIQLVYQNLDSGKVHETTKRYGNHQFIGDTVYELGPEEFIENIKVRSGGVIDYLELGTTKNRIIAKGGKGGGSDRPYSFKGRIVVGTHGGYGGHLHNIGFYVAPKEQVKYWSKRPYILLKEKLEKNKDTLCQYISDAQKQNTKKKDLAELAFALLMFQGDQTFRFIMSFVI